MVLTDTSNPMQIQNLVITDETYNGKGDGTLAIDVTGGSPLSSSIGYMELPAITLIN